MTDNDGLVTPIVSLWLFAMLKKVRYFIEELVNNFLLMFVLGKGKQYSYASLILVIMQSEILLPKQSEKDHLVFGFKFPFYSKKCLNVFHVVNWQSCSNTFFFQNSSYFCLWAIRKSSFAKFLYIWMKRSSLFYAVQERRVATINISIFQGSINQVFCHLYSSKMTIRWLWVPWNRVIRIFSCES